MMDYSWMVSQAMTDRRALVARGWSVDAVDNLSWKEVTDVLSDYKRRDAERTDQIYSLNKENTNA